MIVGDVQLFSIFRESDSTGISGPGRVLDGVVFHTGQVVICWRGDVNHPSDGFSSLGIYPSWEAFESVHLNAHPENKARIVFSH